MSTLRVALLGCGVVGGQVARLLEEQSADLAARIGASVEIVGIAVRRPERHQNIKDDLLTTDAHELVRRADVDVVIEVIGGIEPARSLILTALRSGKSVVTANKALLAEDGATLYDAAAESQVDLYYEASVAGAIPLLRPLRESLAGDRISRVMGIVNGTTNYILSRMDETGAGFSDALDEAGALGYAEADPTADIDGFDAAAKAAILSELAFHTRIRVDDVYREGISKVGASDISSAKEIGCTVKLLAICDRFVDSDGTVSVSARVHPAMIPRVHPLAGVNGPFNAVYVEGEAAGQLMFYGQGAGGAPTASAVLGDLVAVARNHLSGARGANHSAHAKLRVRSIGEAVTRYHISLDVEDRPGVLASVASLFARRDVSISTVRQEGRNSDAILVIVTHTAPDKSLASVVADLRQLDSVRAVASVMRVEGMAGT